MQWRGENRTTRNSVFGRGVLAWLAGVLLSGVIALPAMATDNEIGAVVCGTGSSGASLTIDQPKDDSVVNQALTTFRGTINNTSQIVVEIDGKYVSTVAIGSNQTTFATDVSLSQGTHTIMMTANDICGLHDASDSVVITYQPSGEPSSGGTVPTVVEPAVNAPAPNGEPIPQQDVYHQLQQIPVLGPAVSFIKKIAVSTGLEATVSRGNAIVGASRVIITTAALTSVVMASTLAPLAIQSVPGVSLLFNVASHNSLLYTGWVIRGLGVLAMAFAYFL